MVMLLFISDQKGVNHNRNGGYDKLDAIQQPTQGIQSPAEREFQIIDKYRDKDDNSKF
jgi:hypothetical protein